MDIEREFENSGFDCRVALENEMSTKEIREYFTVENFRYMFSGECNLSDSDMNDLFYYALDKVIEYHNA